MPGQAWPSRCLSSRPGAGVQPLDLRLPNISGRVQAILLHPGYPGLQLLESPCVFQDHTRGSTEREKGRSAAETQGGAQDSIHLSGLDSVTKFVRLKYNPECQPNKLLETFSVSMTRAVAAAALKSLQSCLTLCDPVDGSPRGSSVPGILQARILEWVAISFSNDQGSLLINSYNCKVQSLLEG